MRLGTLQFNIPFFLAPMSGITDYPFRRLVQGKGCGLVFTEMVSAEGLLRKGESLLRIGADEHPVAVQLFGGAPEALSGAAGMAEAMGADVIDINMGCPAKQVVGAGAGVALMRFPERVKAILLKVRKAVKVPLTIKIRSGWDSEEINAVEISKIAEEYDVDAITLHPRTKAQGFQGRADWNLIREVKRGVHIPVVGNGDVTTPFLAKKMIEETGCDGVMIGRAALGNPWVFDSQEGAFLGKNSPFFPSVEERQRVIEQHFSLLRNHYDDRRAMSEIRRHISWYIRGLPSSASFRAKLPELREKEALFEAIASYFSFTKKIPSRKLSVQ